LPGEGDSIVEKKCSRCKSEKPLEDFAINKGGKHGRHSVCKECTRPKSKQHYLSNKEKCDEKSRVWRGNNRDRQLELQSAWRVKNKEKLVRDSKAYYLANKETIKFKLNLYNELYKPRRNQLYNKRYANDPYFRLTKNIFRYINTAIAKNRHGRNWERFVCFTLAELITHFESNFQPGMTWDNHGEWQIDHIRPVSSFHYTSILDEEFKQCWSLENLQPLWAVDNMAKGNRIIEG
jgi:hypothetical protein